MFIFICRVVNQKKDNYTFVIAIDYLRCGLNLFKLTFLSFKKERILSRILNLFFIRTLRDYYWSKFQNKRHFRNRERFHNRWIHWYLDLTSSTEPLIPVFSSSLFVDDQRDRFCKCTIFSPFSTIYVNYYLSSYILPYCRIFQINIHVANRDRS